MGVPPAILIRQEQQKVGIEKKIIFRRKTTEQVINRKKGRIIMHVRNLKANLYSEQWSVQG
jgi:hypothetical protein